MKKVILVLVCLLAAVSCESTLTGQEEKINVAAQNGDPGEDEIVFNWDGPNIDYSDNSQTNGGGGSDGNSSSNATTEAELDAEKEATKRKNK